MEFMLTCAIPTTHALMKVWGDILSCFHPEFVLNNDCERLENPKLLYNVPVKPADAEPSIWNGRNDRAAAVRGTIPQAYSMTLIRVPPSVSSREVAASYLIMLTTVRNFDMTSRPTSPPPPPPPPPPPQQKQQFRYDVTQAAQSDSGFDPTLNPLYRPTAGILTGATNAPSSLRPWLACYFPQVPWLAQNGLTEVQSYIHEQQAKASALRARRDALLRILQASGSGGGSAAAGGDAGGGRVATPGSAGAGNVRPGTVYGFQDDGIAATADADAAVQRVQRPVTVYNGFDEAGSDDPAPAPAPPTNGGSGGGGGGVSAAVEEGAALPSTAVNTSYVSEAEISQVHEEGPFTDI